MTRVLAFILVVTIVALAPPSPARAAWQHGTFQSDGKPVDEYHCAPAGAGPFPAVVLLHGAGPKLDPSDSPFEKICERLAQHGFYADFIEYYTQTGPVTPRQQPQMVKNFPTWLEEIHSGVETLQKNPSVDAKHLGMMGYSLGAFLSLSYGATFPDQLKAIVEYYGGLAKLLYPQLAQMPPVLILHGTADSIVPVAMGHDLDDAMSAANRPHQAIFYDGAQHAFNFEGLPFWYDESAANDSWNQSIKFLDKYLKPAK